MATEENGITTAEALKSTDPSEYTGDTAPDTIKGWNDRRRSNNQIISGLVPFVQMIGLFNHEEYERMFSTDELKRREIKFTDVGGRDIRENVPYTGHHSDDGKNPGEWIKEELSDRFINIYMVDQIESGLSVSPMDGIIMADNRGTSQAVDASGGVGITDLQVDYGKSNIMGSRKFVIRMTVNDPTYLDTHPEYAKLATMGGEFLIIYGWANPKSIPGYSATVAPPLLEQDPVNSERQMMVVPLRNLGNGGYWSAGRVHISTYDFSFNPHGQLEISVTLRDQSTIGLISTRVSTLAPLFKKLMGTGDTTDDKNFINMVITGSGGRGVTIKDQVMLEQQRLRDAISSGTATEEDAAIAANPQQIADSGISIADLGAQNEPLSTVMEKWNTKDGAYFENAGAASNLQDYEQKRQSESLGFPHALGIATYEKVQKHVKIDKEIGGMTDEVGDTSAADPEEEVEHAVIDDYKVKTVYYYLGWVMEGIRLSLSDANRGRQVEGEPIFNPKFFYTDNSNDSQLTTAFQKTIPRSNRNSSMEQRIQEAIIRLKEKCMPPPPRLRGLTVEMLKAIKDVSTRYNVDLTKSPWKDDKIVVPCGGLPVVSGRVTKLKQDIVKVIFPFTPSAREMAAVPHRGHLIKISVLDPQFLHTFAKAVKDDLLDDGWKGQLKEQAKAGQFTADAGHQWYEITLFKPDWYTETEPEGKEVRVGGGAGATTSGEHGGRDRVPAGGSPDGFDPNNPEAYMSADRGGRFYYLIQYPIGARIRGHQGLGASHPNAVNIIMTVNEYRRSDTEIWAMTQRRWHNLYVRFLGVHFERMIRARIQELTAENRTVEEIYDEPVDLDYLTGIVFRNASFYPGDVYALEIANASALGISSTRVRGNTAGWALAPHSSKPDEELVELTGNKGLPWRIEKLEDRRELFVAKLEELSAEGVEYAAALNNIRGQIEDICGGKYEREQVGGNVRLEDGTWKIPAEKSAPTGPGDVLGNLVLSRFKNWRYIIQANKWHAKSGWDRIPVSDSSTDREEATTPAPFPTGPELINIDVWYPTVHYGEGSPTVSLDWIIWEFFSFSEAPAFGTKKIPTDNFYWATFANDPSNISIEDEDANGTRRGHTRVGSPASSKNLQSWWIQKNPVEYEEAKKRRDVHEAELRKLIGMESVQVKKLDRLYIEYADYKTARDNIDNQIEDVENQLRDYSELFTEDKKLRELTPYDDTSDIDKPISIDMGREHPMVLTTKVAYQFYKRFMASNRGGLRKQGCTDVMNYGPPPGGLKYQRPSNNRAFKYRVERAGFPIDTKPMMILDPVNMRKIYEDGREGRQMHYLDYSGDRSIQDLGNREYKNRLENDGAWVQWGAFGVPGTPGDDDRNEYGFKPGIPRTEVGAAGETGGTNVATYGDFLDLFGLKFDPKLAGISKISGGWPSPRPGDIDDNGDPLLFYTTIDEWNNIIQPDGQGWYVTTGWILDYGGQPVYLYPDTNHAVRINSKGAVIQRGYGTAQPSYVGSSSSYWQRQGYEEKGGNPDNQKGNRNSIYGGWSEGAKGAGDGVRPLYWDWAAVARNENIAKQQSLLRYLRGKSGMAGLGIGLAVGSPIVAAGFAVSTVAGLFGWGSSRPVIGKPATSYTNESGVPYMPHSVDNVVAGFGPRLGEGEHNMNLTIDEKRALVIRRGSVKRDFFTLGYDMPAPWSWGRNIGQNIGPAANTDRTMDYWSPITKGGGEFYYYRKDWDGKKAAGSDGRPADFVEYRNMKTVDVKVGNKTFKVRTPKSADEGGHGGVPVWPQIARHRPFTNKDYPYGTGFYRMRHQSGSQRGGDASKIYGAWVFPEKKKVKNYVFWGDFLMGLPGSGFFTGVNNNNNSPTKILPDGTIVDGAELNIGFVQFIIQNVWAPLPKNRRIMTRRGLHPPAVIDAKWSQKSSTKNGYRCYDVCYGDLFAPKPDEEDGKTGNKKDISFANLTNLKIDNVADIPIRRDVVDNLMNKNNNSMSIASFFAEIFKPSSIGIQTAKVNIGSRQRSDGTYEIFQANKNWDVTAQQMVKEYDEATKHLPDRYPSGFMLFDYKSSDSLIQNIDMSSKFDPMIGLTFQHAAEAWTGNADKFATYLAYGNVAVELQDFLKAENPAYEGIIDVQEGTEEAKVNLKALLGDEQGNQSVVPQSVLTKFLMMKPERMQKLNALIQKEPGSNFATQLLAQYMRKTTITIHGTTNLFPFQKILIRGIIPDLEGLYLITNTRESIMAQDFQTIIDAVLIKPVSQVKTQEQAATERQTSS